MRRVVVVVMGLLVLQATPVSAAPDVVEHETCNEGARWRLAVTDTGDDRIKMRFKVFQSPLGHEWHIHFRYMSHSFAGIAYGHVFFRGTKVATDSGVLVVQLSRPDWGTEGSSGAPDGVDGKAVDRQTGEVCKATVWYRVTVG